MSNVETKVMKKRPAGIFSRREVFEKLTAVKEGTRTLEDLLTEMTPRQRGRASTINVTTLQGYTDSILADKKYTISSARTPALHVASRYNTKEGVKAGPIDPLRILGLVKAGKLTGFPALQTRTHKPENSMITALTTPQGK